MMNHLRDAAVLVQVPDRRERHNRQADRLQHDQRHRLAREPARAPRDRGPELERGITDDGDHGDDPAPELAQEVVGDPDHGPVLDPDRPGGRVLRREDEDDAGPDQEAGQRDDEGGHAHLRDHERLQQADRRRAEEADADRRPPRPPGIVRTQEERHDNGSHRAHERDGKVDLADQQDEHGPDRDRRDGRHLQEQVREVPLREEVLVEDAEGQDDDDEADDDRQRPEVACANALPPQARVARERLRLVPLVDGRTARDAPDGRCGWVRAHPSASALASAPTAARPPPCRGHVRASRR